MSGADVIRIQRDVSADGYAVVERVFDHDTTDRARAALDAVLAAEADIADERGWRTDAHHVAYALPIKHDDLLEICLHPKVVEVARAVLGDDCVLAAANGIDLPPGSVGQTLHRDHPVPTPGTTLYLHLVCALDDFRTSNGATLVVPGSQRTPDLDVATGLAADLATPVEVDAGGAIVYDGATVHAAGANTTGSRRRALHLFFARPWVRPHWDFPAMFESRQSDLDVEQRRLLGFDLGARRFDQEARRVLR